MLVDRGCLVVADEDIKCKMSFKSETRLNQASLNLISQRWLVFVSECNR